MYGKNGHANDIKVQSEKVSRPQDLPPLLTLAFDERMKSRRLDPCKCHILLETDPTS